MSTLSCCPPCATVQTVNIPGVEGASGIDGVNGINAYTTTTADFVTDNAVNVVMNVDSSVWMVIGQVLIVGVGVGGGGSGPAHVKVMGLPSSTSASVLYLDIAGDIGNAQTILAGSTVSPSAV